MKLLHSSDLLIGLPFAHAWGKADALRASRMAALRDLLGRARADKVQALLLCGNTLADNRLSERELNELASALKTSAVPVYVLPGRTDPYTADSPYRLRADLFASVHVLGEACPVRLDGFTLYPCPVRSRAAENADPTAWIPPREAEDGLRIGLACVEEMPARPDLDYLALGAGRWLNGESSLAGAEPPRPPITAMGAATPIWSHWTVMRPLA